MTNAEFALNAKTKREIGELIWAFQVDQYFLGKFLNIDEWLEQEHKTLEQTNSRVDVMIINEELAGLNTGEANGN